MKAPSILVVLAALAIALCGSQAASCQRPVGSVSTEDAAVSNAGGGILMASGGRAVMFGSSTVTAAKDHSAAITLDRGGEIRVCQTTNLHLAAAADDTLLMGLDRGSMEIRMKAKSGDVVMTPDLRFTMAAIGQLDLQMRVTTNGDTCVDNRGKGAPTLRISSAFGDASYEVRGGQHVLFEHGNLREVVDHESTSCGCPPDERRTPSANSAAAGKLTPAQTAAAAHPFPEAVSEGLGQPQTLPADTPGQTHVQVATTLGYDPSAPKSPADEDTPAPSTRSQNVKKHGGFFSAIGRLFKRLFIR